MAADRSATGAAAEQANGTSANGAHAHATKVEACSQCGAAEPPHRCTGCRKTAYCSRKCQQAHWVAGGHKHDCKKLRKAQHAGLKLGSSAHAANGVAGAGAGAAASSEGGCKKEDPAESNSTPPLPRRLLYPAERYAELAAAPPQRKQPLGLQNVGNRWVGGMQGWVLGGLRVGGSSMILQPQHTCWIRSLRPTACKHPC